LLFLVIQSFGKSIKKIIEYFKLNIGIEYSFPS